MQANEKRGWRPLKIGAAIAAVAAGGALAAPSFGGTANPPGLLISKMTGNQVVPQGDGARNGEGEATFRVRPRRGIVRYSVEFKATGGPVEGYIFRGERGVEPPNPQRPAVTLFGEPKPSPQAGRVTGLRRKLLHRMRQRPRRFHVVLVNERHENGAVRGQLRRPRN